LTVAGFPLYATYELAPQFYGLDAATDQQMAGLIMKFGNIHIVSQQAQRRGGQVPDELGQCFPPARLGDRVGPLEVPDHPLPHVQVRL